MGDGWAHYGYAPAIAAAVTAAASPPFTRPQVAVVEARTVGGRLTARLDGPSAGSAWLIRRITVSTPGSTTRVRAYVYVGEPAPETLVMGTNSGTLDTAVEDPPLFVPDSTPLVAQWDTGPTRALARIEYQEI
jgi:hypothetical protein